MDVHRLLEEEGILLEAARGPTKSVAENVAGEPLAGSWWGHPAGNEIFTATRSLRDSSDVLVCRLVNGKVTFVHRRLWPAIVRLADALGHERLSQLHEEHGVGGRHVVHETAFPDWVPDHVTSEAEAMTEREAIMGLPEPFRNSLLEGRG